MDKRTRDQFGTKMDKNGAKNQKGDDLESKQALELKKGKESHQTVNSPNICTEILPPSLIYVNWILTNAAIKDQVELEM